MMLKNTSSILTIDDERGIRQSIAVYLEDSGFVVYEAASGAEGVAIFKDKQPDLVLTDLQMPGMHGLEVLREITSLNPEIPVIVVSGAGGMHDVIEALRLGAWDYLTKPIADLAVLEHTIRKVLERARLIKENKNYRRELEEANQSLKKNLTILQEDQEAGRSVQLKLLPEQQVTFANYTFSHAILPSLYLSGDFVGYFPINANLVGCYLADVSGHGASSAFVTILLKGLMEKMLDNYQLQQDETILEPHKACGFLSQEIYSAKLGKYLTMIYGVIDLTSNKLTYTIGGHYPNPVLVDNQVASYLPGRGFPLGIMHDAKYESYTIDFPLNATLLLFSDGLLELMSEKTMAEKDISLLQLLTTMELDNSIINKIFKGDKQQLPDDVTMLLIRRNQ